MPWSLSQFGLYDQCPAKYKFRHKDRLPDPRGPAASRGSEIHNTLEKYLETGSWAATIPPYTINKAESMRNLGYQPEVKLAFDDKWQLVEWDSPIAWIRGVIDSKLVAPPEIHMGEWKTGKIYEDHDRQRHLYLTMALSGWPNIQKAVISTIYVDQSHSIEDSMEREQLREAQEVWEKRFIKIQGDTFFSPRPGGHCTYCNFSKKKGGPCIF